LSTTDTDANVKALEYIQNADEGELFERVRENREIAARLHSWEKFTSSVMDFMGL